MTIVPQKPLLSYTPERYPTWRLACAVALSPDQPQFETALNAIRDELSRRGVTVEAIAEMTALAKWAVEVINPIVTPNGRGTAESNGSTYQIVANREDIELALDVAERRHQVSDAEARRIRTVLARQVD